PGCCTAGVAAGGTTIGLPAAAADSGAFCWTLVGVPATAGVAGACLPEFSETKVAQPSTRAIAAPAARPTLSRRDFWPATIGYALWLARTSAFSLSSSRGSVCGTAAGSADRTGSSQGPRIVFAGDSVVTRLLLMSGVRQLVAIKGSHIGKPDC